MANVWTARDLAARPDTAWVETALEGGHQVGSLAPWMYEARARVLHPAALGDRPIRWSTVADVNARVMYPLVEWDQIVPTRSARPCAPGCRCGGWTDVRFAEAPTDGQDIGESWCSPPPTCGEPPPPKITAELGSRRDRAEMRRSTRLRAGSEAAAPSPRSCERRAETARAA